MQGFMTCNIIPSAYTTCLFVWGVSDHRPVYQYVIVITEVLPGELGVVVDDDRVGDPKVEDYVLDKAYRLFGANFGHETSLKSLSELVDRDKQVGEAPRRFFEWSQEVRAPQGKGPCNGDGLELLGWCVDLPRKVFTPFARPHKMNCVIEDRRPTKTLPEGFTDHGP
jgi:hypothetical protein